MWVWWVIILVVLCAISALIVAASLAMSGMQRSEDPPLVMPRSGCRYCGRVGVPLWDDVCEQCHDPDFVGL